MIQVINNTDKPQRWAVISVAPALVANLWVGVFHVESNAMPPDVRVIRSGYDALADVFACVVESAEFPEVMAGSMLKELRPPAVRTLTRKNGDKARAMAEAAGLVDA